MVLIFEVPTCAIFNIIENDFFSIQGLKFFNIGSSGWLSELSVFQPRRLTNGAFATPKQQGPEGRTGPAGHGPQFLTLLSEPTRKLAL